MVRVEAPGRVNLIGEHTDYNEGFVLPVAIDRCVWIEADRCEGGSVRLYSEVFDQEHIFALNDIRSDPEYTWANYVKGVASVLLDRGFVLGGAEMRIGGNVPQGAGLSSSAAIEVAACLAFAKMFNLGVADTEIPHLCRRAENEFVGVECGIMDQFASVFGQKDTALFLDCRSLEYRHVPFPAEDASLVIIDTKVERRLASSEYNRRRDECREGVRILRETGLDAASLRDVTSEQLQENKHLLPESVAKRCEHVVNENHRVLNAVKALESSDMDELGRLFYDSHDSLRDLFEVSCRELDIVVDLARNTDGVLGARMTGAGFGGCVVSLVRRESVSQFTRKVRVGYEQQIAKQPDFHAFKPSDGAFKLNADD